MSNFPPNCCKCHQKGSQVEISSRKMIFQSILSKCSMTQKSGKQFNQVEWQFWVEWQVRSESKFWSEYQFHLQVAIVGASLLGLWDLWKGLFVAREVRGWCHECQFLHHEGRRVSSKSPEWCKNWHEWHHPLTSSATKSPFQRSRRPKRNWFSAEKQFAATEDFSRCSNQHDRMFFHIG